MLNKSRASASTLYLFVVMKMSNYENYIINVLKAERVKFCREKTFKDLKMGMYRFDFYLPNYCGKEIIIEMDGEQHFKPIYGR
jgi:very-short-patch-repair endonuclease